MGQIQTGNWKSNTLFIAVFLLLTYVLLLASMAKNNASIVNKHGFITVDKSELVILSNFEKLITTVLLKPQSYLYQDEIFIVSGQKHTQVNIHSFEEHLFASFIDMAIPFAALFLIALTTIVMNAFYYRNKVSKEIAPLCRKVDSIISSYNLSSVVHKSAANLNALNHSLDFLHQISNEYQVKAEQHSFCDKLTHLVDRYHFLDHIKKQLTLTTKAGTKSGLLFIDLDGFKSVNDSYGHSFGDEVLIQVAERLRSIVRRKNLSFKQDSNALEYNLSRLGGDEFTILLNNVDSKACILKIVQQILKSFEEPANIENKMINIQLSIGITTVSNPNDLITDVIKKADIATKTAAKPTKL